jgi:uncharacterized protein (TIGR03437 family)
MTAMSLASVSAASYDSAMLAPDSIAAAFGADISNTTQAAGTTPLPTELAGTRVKLRDSVGIEHFAPLFFVSPTQVNYQVPPAAALGFASATVLRSNLPSSCGPVMIARVAPGLFAADASGKGVAAAVVLRIKADGTSVTEPVVRFDPVLNRFIAVPIDLGPSTDQVFLSLFGTGIKQRSSLSVVSLTIGGASAEVTYAGQQGQFVGLDQVNGRIPRSLAGRGEVDVVLVVDGKTANTVHISIK